MKKILQWLVVLSSICISIYSIILLTSCTRNNSETGKIAVICTSAVKTQSELIILNNQGTPINSIPLKAQGIFKLEKLDNNTLVLPVTYSDQIIKVDLTNNQTSYNNTRLFPIFYNNLGNREFIVFNSDPQGDIDYLTYLLKDQTGERLLRIKGYPLALTIVENTAYIYLDKKTEPDSILILDLTQFKVLEELRPFTTSIEGVREIKYIDGSLIIPIITGNQLIKLPLDSSELSVTELTYPAPGLIFEHDTQVIVIHYSGGISVLDRKTFATITTTKYNFSIINGQISDNQLYLLVKEDSTRKLVILELNTLEIIQTIDVKPHANLLLQNFVILN